MTLLLDSNVLIGLLKGHQGLLAKVQQYEVSTVFLSAIVLHELAFGAFNGNKPDFNLRRLEGMAFPQLPFDRHDAIAAGELRAHLRRLGTPIGNFDTLIAGQALARGMTLVTHNTREFSRVPGLQLEDWEA